MAQTIGQLLGQMRCQIALPIGDYAAHDRYGNEQHTRQVQETRPVLGQTIIEHLFEDPGYGQTEADYGTGTGYSQEHEQR
jgi:hypothetical protein